MFDVVRIVTGPWKENCYIVSTRGDAVVIDPGGEFEQIKQAVGNADLRVHAVINTHAHFDHVGAVAPVTAQYGIPFHLHPADVDLLRRANFYRTLFQGEGPIRIPPVDAELAPGDRLNFGALELEVIHTPGHTRGSVCFASGDQLFSGDTIMAEHLGRTDLPDGDRTTLLASIQLLATRFAPETQLLSGHGRPAVLGDVLPRVATLPEFLG